MSGIISDNVGRASGLVKAAGGGGKILQVIDNPITAQYSSSSARFVSIGTPVFTITPSATSSKIFLMCNLCGGTGNWMMLKFMRDIGGGGYEDIGLPDTATGNQSNAHFQGLGMWGNRSDALSVSWNYIDSPSTTSAVNYQLWGLSHNPDTIYINRSTLNEDYAQIGGTTSSVTLMEIGV